jgi:16S rRNA (cytidine1402-2'-O)-methyltransferase
MRPQPPALNTATLDPGLYVISTPIGNLRDITLRALDILSLSDLVLAEDTRVAQKLLSVYGLSRPVERYDDHCDDRIRPKVLEMLSQGNRVALVSDAGTPLVSDPGYRLVKAAADAGAPIYAAPGPSALLAALAVSGLPSDRFLFAGFMPPKSTGRRAMLEELSPIRATLIFYETGPRLTESLRDMLAVCGDRQAVVARELTKLYETVLRGPLSELIDRLGAQAPKGEIVVLIAPGTEAPATGADMDQALIEALAHSTLSDAAATVAKSLGLNRKTVYRRALELKSGRTDTA